MCFACISVRRPMSLCVCKYISFLHFFLRLKVTLIITIHIFRCFFASILFATRIYLSLFITLFFTLPLSASSLPLNLYRSGSRRSLLSHTHAPRSRSPSLHARKYTTRARARAYTSKEIPILAGPTFSLSIFLFDVKPALTFRRFRPTLHMHTHIHTYLLAHTYTNSHTSVYRDIGAWARSHTRAKHSENTRVCICNIP